GGTTAGPIATAMLRSILGGEDAVEARNVIYARMQYIYQQIRLAREKMRAEAEAQENGETLENIDGEQQKETKTEEDERIKYE
ncbi:hypothetical protein SZ49_01230, partial [Brachyspira hyodysenteriae]